MAGKNGISGLGIATLAGGSILLWSALKGRSWSAVLKELITGQQPSTATQENPISVAAPASSTANPGLTGPIQNTPAGLGKSASVIQNKSTVRLQAAAYGWASGSNWNSLDQIITHESSWNNKALNPSGAYGLFQALPHTKMPKAAWPESEGGSSDPVVQAKWGLAYIKQRYHTPDEAWAWWQTHNWY